MLKTEAKSAQKLDKMQPIHSVPGDPNSQISRTTTGINSLWGTLLSTPYIIPFYCGPLCDVLECSLNHGTLCSTGSPRETADTVCCQCFFLNLNPSPRKAWARSCCGKPHVPGGRTTLSTDYTRYLLRILFGNKTARDEDREGRSGDIVLTIIGSTGLNRAFCHLSSFNLRMGFDGDVHWVKSPEKLICSLFNKYHCTEGIRIKPPLVAV